MNIIMDGIARRRARLTPALRGALFYFAYWGVVGVYVPFINVAFVGHGLNGRELGILSTLLPLMTLVVTPPLALLADRRSRRVRYLTLAVVGLALALTLIGFGRSFAALFPLMLLLGIVRAPIAPFGDGLVVRMAARHRLDYGRMRLWGSFSFALVAILSGVVWQRTGYDPMFFVAGALFLPVALAAALLEEPETTEERAQISLGGVLGDRALLTVLGAAFLVGAAIGMDIIFEGIIMEELGGNASMIGLLLGVSAFSELPAMHYGAALTRRFGSRRALLLAVGVLSLGLAGFALAWHAWQLLAFGVLRGLGFGVFFVSTVQAVDERVPPQWSASVQAVLNASMWGLAPLVAGPIGGLLFDGWGVKTVYVVATVAVALAAVVLVAAPVARGIAATVRGETT